MRAALSVILLFACSGQLLAGDLEDLQGYWLSLDDPWSVEINGNVATFHGTYPFVDAYQGKHDDVELRFTLADDTKPRQFDLNADDLQQANERLKAKYQRSLGIYRVHGDQLTLQFSSRKHLEEFDHWEGAPSNHARPFSRRLRRVSPEELKLLKSLSGVWRGEIRDGKQLVQIETMYIQPGWLKGLQFTPSTRLQLLDPQETDGKQPLVIHSHHVTRGTGFLGGSYTTHYWLAGIGTASIEPQRITAEVDWMFKDKRLNDAAFQTKAALDANEVKEIRELQPKLSIPLRSPLQLTLTRIADKVTFQYGSIPNSPQYSPVATEVLTGDWRVLLHRTARPNPKGEASITYTPDPENERWTFSAGKCQIARDGKTTTRLWKQERHNSLHVFAEAEPDKQLGWWQIQYEPQAKILRVQRSERIDDVFVSAEYVLERMAEKR